MPNTSNRVKDILFFFSSWMIVVKNKLFYFFDAIQNLSRKRENITNNKRNKG